MHPAHYLTQTVIKITFYCIYGMVLSVAVAIILIIRIL